MARCQQRQALSDRNSTGEDGSTTSLHHRADIHRSLHREMALSGELLDHAFVGAEVPPRVALDELAPVREVIAARIPELRGLLFTRAGNKVLLVSPTQRVVLAVLE
jgi:hypothetical protein